MKKITSILKHYLLITPVIIMFSCNSGKTEENVADALKQEARLVLACTIDCSNEKKLVLEAHALPLDSGRKERRLFDSLVSTSAGTVNTLADNVSYEEFCRLKGYASGITSTCGIGNTITGIRIFLGLESDLQNMKLIYQPIKLCLISNTTTAGTFSIVGSYNTMFSYNESTDRFEENTTVDSDKQRYIDNILIVHSNGSNPEHHTTHPTNDTLSDVKSVVFSFQEIQLLYQENDSPNHPDHITVWNSLKAYPSSGTTIKKHSVFLGPNYLDSLNTNPKYIFSGEYRGAYANLAHLCPPNCNPLIFRIQ